MMHHLDHTQILKNKWLQKACASEGIISLRMCHRMCMKCAKPCITKRICMAHHHILLMLWLWVGRLIRTKRIVWLLSHCCHLDWRRGSNAVWQSKWILYLKWIGGWRSINRPPGSSICSFIVQTVQSERVQAASLTFIDKMVEENTAICLLFLIQFQSYAQRLSITETKFFKHSPTSARLRAWAPCDQRSFYTQAWLETNHRLKNITLYKTTHKNKNDYLSTQKWECTQHV